MVTELFGKTVTPMMDAVHMSFMSPSLFVILFGIFEVVIGLGLIFNIFVKLFAILIALFLLFVIFSFGLNEVTVRDVGLIGAALALLFWNGRKKF